MDLAIWADHFARRAAPAAARPFSQNPAQN